MNNTCSVRRELFMTWLKHEEKGGCVTWANIVRSRESNEICSLSGISSLPHSPHSTWNSSFTSQLTSVEKDRVIAQNFILFKHIAWYFFSWKKSLTEFFFPFVSYNRNSNEKSLWLFIMMMFILFSGANITEELKKCFLRQLCFCVQSHLLSSSLQVFYAEEKIYKLSHFFSKKETRALHSFLFWNFCCAARRRRFHLFFDSAKPGEWLFKLKLYIFLTLCMG